MADVKTYRDLDAWQCAMDLVEMVHRVTRSFPGTERYGLMAQMRRSSVSIPSNIAEGQGRGSAKFGLHFIRIALGSAAEIDTQLEVAKRLRLVPEDTAAAMSRLIQRVRQLLYGMRREHARRITSGEAVVSMLLATTALLA